LHFHLHLFSIIAKILYLTSTTAVWVKTHQHNKCTINFRPLVYGLNVTTNHMISSRCYNYSLLLLDCYHHDEHDVGSEFSASIGCSFYCVVIKIQYCEFHELFWFRMCVETIFDVQGQNFAAFLPLSTQLKTSVFNYLKVKKSKKSLATQAIHFPYLSTQFHNICH
jgi:hypothetical protein